MVGDEARRALGMQTPSREPKEPVSASLKTPLRTPLRNSLEQTSSTPITPFELIEKQKENVQPRSRGRSAHALSTTFSMQHKERQDLLNQQRQEHERAVTSVDNAESDDPLEAWCNYVKWCVDNYPSGNSAESGLVVLLERATRTFKDSEQYRNDSRYLRLWILYAQNTEVPRDVFQFLLANEIGTRLASLYEELASVLEAHGVYDEADSMYKLGIARRASPLDRLKRRYQEYQSRVLSLPESSSDETPTYAKALASAMARVGRSVLGTKTAHGESKPTNVLGHHQPISQAVRSNARTMNVYRDENDQPATQAHTPSGWDKLNSDQERRKENVHAPRSLKSIQNTTPRSQLQALEVFCDSDEDHSSPERKSPQKNIFQRAGSSDADRLRKSPFLFYSEEQRKPHHIPIVNEDKPAVLAEPVKSEKQHKSRSRVHAKSTKTSQPERHIAPLPDMYPGADIQRCLSEKHRPIQATHELCYEELQALRRNKHALDLNDAYAALDQQHGRWLPERNRAPSPTLVTKAAILEVDSMFNGGDEEDEEDEQSSESSSDESDEETAPVVDRRMYDENNENLQVTAANQTPRSNALANVSRTPFGQSTRTPLCNTSDKRVLPPSESSHLANYVYESEEDTDEEQQPSSAMQPDTNAENLSPGNHLAAQRYESFISTREPFQPLTPITERTEISRWTTTTSTDDSYAEVAAQPVESDADAIHLSSVSYTTEQLEPTGGLLHEPCKLGLPNPCSPADPDVLRAILENLAKPVSSMRGYIDLHNETSPHLIELNRAIKGRTRRSSVGSQASDASAGLSVGNLELIVLRKIGEGGYGAVFLAQDVNESVPFAGDDEPRYQDLPEEDLDLLEQSQYIALKVERPANPWEFFILSELRARLPASLHPSIVGVRKFASYSNESMLLLNYGAQGTLLELVNHARSAGVAAVPAASGSLVGGVEEVLAIFFMINLLQIVEGMHRADILHGDLKIDNCMIRAPIQFDGKDWPSSYDPTDPAWGSRGVMLIDFGRAIDLRCYPKEQTFLADWTPGSQDCVEMHEMRPWTYQADYYGLASIAYCLLFGKYMETTSFVAVASLLANRPMDTFLPHPFESKA
ncbi:non-specific serine/threonine protein kinase [Malassezia psittaci]|uniref:Non-specific serine/threonine protein kinase n=1 Tax=Malassezia psittaci TaxID=1821823 RepID=A0AAF0JCY4_9BASI|nr:non-specific serine/threonine protein kinase [Malassezia psittaci]